MLERTVRRVRTPAISVGSTLRLPGPRRIRRAATNEKNPIMVTMAIEARVPTVVKGLKNCGSNDIRRLLAA